MTLMGKIFRPWDLSSNETFVSKSEKQDDEEGTSEVEVKPSAFLAEDDVSSDRSEDVEVNKKTQSSSRHCRESSKTCERPSSLPSSPLNPLGSGSISSTYPANFHDLNHPHASYFLPSSPVGTQASSPSAASFMSSSSINELASLTRTELTAMGLLPPEPPSAMKVKRQRPKRFRCPHCQVAFSNNGQLRGHIRIHTGERPFACDHEGCGKSFTRNEELTRHRRIHTGLRPYPCTHCGKKFGRKDHLKKHIRTHQRPMFNASSGMIGLGNPFHPYNPSLLPSHSTIAEFGAPHSPFALPFMLSIPPPISHFPFS